MLHRSLMLFLLFIIKPPFIQVTDMFQLCTPWTGENPGVLVGSSTSLLAPKSSLNVSGAFLTVDAWIYHK